MRQSSTRGESLGILAGGQAATWEKKNDASNALDYSSARSRDLFARARKGTRPAVQWRLNFHTMPIDGRPVSSLPGEWLGSRRPTYAANWRRQLCTGTFVGLRQHGRLG
jgi:hypothetical protein